MNCVIGMTDLLLETDLDARQRDYAQTVRDSGEALLTIINDILDLSKVEAGKLEIEVVEFSLRTVIDEVVDLLASSAKSKGLELVAVTAEQCASHGKRRPGSAPPGSDELPRQRHQVHSDRRGRSPREPRKFRRRKRRPL